MSEIQWGFYHLSQDEKEESKKFSTLLEIMTALLNPEAYKKYKNTKEESNIHVSDEFISILMKESGMTEEEAKAFMENRDSADKGEQLDVVLSPFTI